MHPAVRKHKERTEALKAKGLIPARKGNRPARRGPCIHGPGAPTGQTRPCQGCGGKVQQVPLLACGKFGVCTVGQAVKLEDGTPVRPCNRSCPGYEPSSASV